MSDGAAGDGPPPGDGGPRPRRTGPDDNVVRPDGEQQSEQPGLGSFGLLVFLASLSMLFAASIVGFLLIRFRADVWPPPGAPSLPPELALSTLLALGCSVAMQLGLNAIRTGDGPGLLRYLWTASGLSVGFVAVQTVAWFRFFDAATFEGHLYGFTFYMLTGLHALHVIGGMIALGWTLHRARRGAYNWAHYPGVRHCTMYWHFLDGVWLVLYGVLLLAS